MYRKLLIRTMLACVILMPAIATATSNAKRVDATISVTGTAVSSEAPDRVAVTFGVETLESTSQAALSANSNLMQKVTRALLELEIDDEEISTSQFNIHAQYENHHNRETGVNTQVLTGYRVSNVLRVETPVLDLVAGVIDAAVEAGVNRVDNISFFLSPAAMSELQDGLIEAAVNDARARAQRALAPLKQQITGVQQVSLSDFAGPMPRQLNLQRMEMAQSAPTQVFAGQQQIRTSVNVTFLIGPETDTK